MSDELLFCPGCGFRQPEAGTKYCLKCGAALTAPAAPDPARWRSAHWIVPLFLLLIVLVALSACATALYEPAAQGRASATPMVAAAVQDVGGVTRDSASDAGIPAAGVTGTPGPTVPPIATAMLTLDAAAANAEAAAAELAASTAGDISDIVQLAPYELRRIGRGSLNDVAISPRNNLLAVATGLGVWIYRLGDPGDRGELLPTDSMATAVSWSPDGSRLAVQQLGGGLQIWDPQAAVKIGSVGDSSCSGGLPTDLAWSADGTRIAADCGHSVSVFDATTGEFLATCLRSIDQVRLAWSPDGSQLAATVVGLEGGRPGPIAGCRADTGHFERNLLSMGANERAWDAAWSPDGKYIAVSMIKQDNESGGGARKQVLRLLDSSSGQAMREIITTGAEFAWSPDGKNIAVNEGDRIVIYDPSNAEAADSIDGLAVGMISSMPLLWSPDGSFLVNASSNGTVYIWDVASRSLAKTLRGHNHLIRAFPWSDDGVRVAAVDTYAAIDEWDGSSGQLLVRHSVRNVWALSPDWLQAVTSDWQTARLQVRSVHDGSVMCELPEAAGDDGYYTTWSPDGKWISTRPDEKTLRLWHAGDCTLAGDTDGYARIGIAHWSPDSRNLAYVLDDRTIISTTPEGLDNAMPWSANLEFYISDIAWAPDMTKIAAIGNRELWISEVGYRYPEVVLSVPLDIGDDAAVTLAWSPDGSRFAVGTSDGRILIFSAATGKRLLSLQGHNMRGPDVWWSPDGRRLLSNADDGTLRIWDASETASLVPVIEPPASPTPLPAPTQTPEPVAVGDLPSAPVAGAEGRFAGQIVFLSSRDYSDFRTDMPFGLRPHDVYSMNADGSGQNRITSDLRLTNMSAPAVSPSGAQIAIGDRGTGAEVRLLSPDGAVEATLPVYRADVRVGNWSSSGLLLTAFGGEAAPNQIIMYVQSNGYLDLTQNTMSNGYGAISPDGKTVAFQNGPDTSVEHLQLWLMSVDGTNKRLLLDRNSFDIAWSLDGQQIAFESYTDPTTSASAFDIWVVKADGTDARNLTQGRFRRHYSPTWSPDGSKIAFAASPDGRDRELQIFVMDLTTGEMTQITNQGNNFEPYWAPPAASLGPTGKALLFSDRDFAKTDAFNHLGPQVLYAKGADSSDQTRVSCELPYITGEQAALSPGAMQ